MRSDRIKQPECKNKQAPDRRAERVVRGPLGEAILDCPRASAGISRPDWRAF
jgi:hypothetical protein